MDKLAKALKKLSPKEKISIKNILVKIKNNSLAGMDLKKLKSHDNVFRVRKGKIRIIFQFKNKNIFILSIEKRQDKTYKI